MGGYAPKSSDPNVPPPPPTPISNKFVTLNCDLTEVFVSQADKQVQVRWNFTPKSPFVGTNSISLEVFDLATAHSGFVNPGSWSWTVTNPSGALMASGGSAGAAPNATFNSDGAIYTAESPYVGEMPANGRPADFPTITESDGTTGPPESTDLSTTAPMNNASTAPSAQAAPSSAAAVQSAPRAPSDTAPSGQTS